ncbi:MAG: sorbosone dehydrogenase family protein [Kofleriaceae bacterium]
MMLVSLVAAACGDSKSPTADAAPADPTMVTLEVPAGSDLAPLDKPRTVKVPAGFGLRVIARIPKARFMAEAPNGDVLVSQPSQGKIHRISNIGSAPIVGELASGLDLPHDMVFAEIGGQLYLYVAETNKVSRTPWNPSDTTLGALTAVVANLPDATLPELMGGYGHALKNIAIGGDTLYVAIASATNASVSDILADPVRGAIYAYDLDGSNGRLFAKGLRNAEGLAIHPTTGELWAAVNHRDNIAYPLQDGRFAYKSVVTEYVNDNPPEPFTRVRDGGNYGWPYCNPTAENGLDNMPYHPDVQNNEGQTELDCSAIDRISKGLEAHSAPLGMSFWTGANAPEQFRNAAVIGMHGCWNCSVPRGYRVELLAANSDNSFADPVALVSGFLSDPTATITAWGRPVDVIPNKAGNLYISDDFAGAVYELYRK